MPRTRLLGLAIAASLACGEHEPPLPPATTAHDDASAPPSSVAEPPASATREPAWIGDPGAAEREIVAVGPPEISDEELLGLPGSHGLPPAAAARLPIADTGKSVGTPEAGALEGGIQLPFDPAVYTRRDARRSYATSQTLRTIQTALDVLRRDRGVLSEVIIGDISLPRGGTFPPHVSHTSGRDLDIRLVLAPGLERTTVPFAAEHVDWDATWALVHSFLETGTVTYVFLDLERQPHLHAAALRAGVHARVLERWFQWPRGLAAETIVRHEPGHRAHLHIRLSCAGQGPRCHGA